jgi:transaldolase
MNATQKLHELGQSLWLDNITRGLLDSGTLNTYLRDFSVSGLTSNPTIFELAIRNNDFYDEAIRQKSAQGKSGSSLFFELALEDLTRAADMLLPIHKKTAGVDGWVSLEVSPLFADDAASTTREAKRLHSMATRQNLFIKIPGTPAGLVAIEETIFAGVPVNVTLLFSREQYLAAASAYARGVERRVAAGLDPKIGSVASLFVSRWDVAVKDKVPKNLANRLGVAVARQTYGAYRELLASPRWSKLSDAGAMPQRLLWASTGTKDPTAPDTMYVEALAATGTINTMPENTLLAFASHGTLSGTMEADGGNVADLLADFAMSDIDLTALAEELQKEGLKSFKKSWSDLMAVITAKSAPISEAATAETEQS